MRHPIRLAVLATVLAAAAAPCVSRAADADKPYSNVDKKNDAGNNTGNSSVEKLNDQQLDENQPKGSKSDGFDRNGQSQHEYKPRD